MTFVVLCCFVVLLFLFVVFVCFSCLFVVPVLALALAAVVYASIFLCLT